MKPKLAAAVKDLHEAELSLASEYRRIGERHAADHDVFHICHTLAQQCDAHAHALTSFASTRGVRLDESPAGDDSPWRSFLSTLRRSVSTVTGRSDKTGPLLLSDLRHLFTAASDCEIAWTIVGQGAKASRDDELEQLFTECCEETAGQLRWIKTKIKLAAPQVLTVG